MSTLLPNYVASYECNDAAIRRAKNHNFLTSAGDEFPYYVVKQ